jgi:esterase/lipase
MLLASWYFRNKGYAYFRCNLYHWDENARTLGKSDLFMHASDTEVIAAYLRRKGYKNLFAVGHSLGGLTLLLSDNSIFKAMSLWDCSSLLKFPFHKRLKKIRGSKYYYLPGSYELLISEQYKKGFELFPGELELMANVKIPTQICYASSKDAVLSDSSKQYFKAATCEKELVAIKGASHSFTEERIGEVLFQKTVDWFQRYE